MLVISRKADEAIIIESQSGGQPIEIKIISIENQVKLGIDAPKDCKIWRKELFNTVESNRKATQITSPEKLKGLTFQISGGDGEAR